MDATAGHIIIDGNTAAALGCVYAGATVGAWYPITPSTSLMDAFKVLLRAHCASTRTRAARTTSSIQAEDELASIGMVIGAVLERRARLHRHLGSWHLADEGVPGAGLLRGSPDGGLRHPARRTLDRHADAHAAVRSHAARLRLARRHAPRVPLSGQSRGVLRHCGQGVRSGRAAADPGAGAVGSGYRHERLDVPGSQVGRQLPARSRQGARCRSSSRSSSTSGATTTRTTTASPQRTLPGVHPKGAYFTRGSGHTQYGTYTEDSKEYQIVLDRLRKKWVTAKRLVPQRGHRCDRRQRYRHRVARQLRRGGARGAWTCSRRAGRPRRLHARARLSLQRGSRALPAGHEHAVRGGAEPRRAAALAADCWRPAVEKSQLRSLLHYNGLPISCELHRRRRGCRARPQASPRAPPMAVTRSCARSRRPHDLHGQAQGRAPVAAEECARPHAPRLRGRRLRRCAPAAATTRSPPPSSKPAGRIALEPQNMVKLSGIGCSSKTTAYFVSGGHGFNSVHGRMPSIATGANAANRELHLHRGLGRRRYAVDRPRAVLPCDPPQPRTCCTSSRTTACTG